MSRAPTKVPSNSKNPRAPEEDSRLRALLKAKLSTTTFRSLETDANRESWPTPSRRGT
jgi:hypothetical protein